MNQRTCVGILMMALLLCAAVSVRATVAQLRPDKKICPDFFKNASRIVPALVSDKMFYVSYFRFSGSSFTTICDRLMYETWEFA
jgi:hypothetical protein